MAPEKGVKQVVVTNFQTNTWKLRDGGNVSFPIDIKVGEIVTFTSAQDAVRGPGVELFGYAIKHNSLMASYVGMTTGHKVNGIPTIYTYKSAGAYATAWQQLPDASVKTVEITDFAIPGLNITKDGESFLFYANDASNIPNSNRGATSFVGVAIASPIFITGDQRLLYYMMVDTASGMFYTGRANLEDDIVAWNTTPITRLGQAVQVTAFTEPALSALLYSYKPGDFIPFLRIALRPLRRTNFRSLEFSMVSSPWAATKEIISKSLLSRQDRLRRIWEPASGAPPSGRPLRVEGQQNQSLLRMLKAWQRL